MTHLWKDNYKYRSEKLTQLLQIVYGCSYTEVDALAEAIDLFRIDMSELEEYDVFREGFGLFEIHQAVIEIIKSRMLGDEPDLMETIVEGYVPGGTYISYHFIVDNEENYKKIQKYCDEHSNSQWNWRFLSHSSYKLGYRHS